MPQKQISVCILIAIVSQAHRQDHHNLSHAKLHTIRKSHLDMGKDSRWLESDRNNIAAALIGSEVVVHARPHTVGATATGSKGRGKSTDSVFENDSKSFPPEVRYEIVSNASSKPGRGGSSNSGMRKHAHAHAGLHAVEQNALERGHEGNIDEENDDDYDFDIDNDQDNSLGTEQQQQQQRSSVAATRSQFFSNGSISDAKKLVRVPMQRQRTARKLDRHHVAGGFTVMSFQHKKNITKLLDATEQIQSGLDTNFVS